MVFVCITIRRLIKGPILFGSLFCSKAWTLYISSHYWIADTDVRFVSSYQGHREAIREIRGKHCPMFKQEQYLNTQYSIIMSR